MYLKKGVSLEVWNAVEKKVPPKKEDKWRLAVSMVHGNAPADLYLLVGATCPKEGCGCDMYVSPQSKQAYCLCCWMQHGIREFCLANRGKDMVNP